MDGEPLATFMSKGLPENVANEACETAKRESGTCYVDNCNPAAVSGHDLPLAVTSIAGKTGSKRASKHNIMEMKAVCSCDRQRIQYQQSIEFLRSQHQELVGNLHEESERLKRKNRGLITFITVLLL